MGIDVEPCIADIRRILLTEWDPIGIGRETAAQDEYDAYARRAEALLAAGSPASQIADYLIEIEAGSMGLAADRDRAERVAARLWSIARDIR